MRNERFRSPAAEAIKLDESGVGDEFEIQVIREGKFNHPWYGPFDINKKVLNAFKKNFKNNALKVDIMLDYAHNSHLEAAAWFKDVYIDEDSKGRARLMAKVSPTEAGKKKIESKEYRYISADFSLEYVDPETGDELGPVLHGAGLTNRPFVKEMDPVVQLSDFADSNREPKKGENAMTLQEAQSRIEDLETQLSEKRDDLKVLSEKKLTAAKAVERIDALEKQLADVNTENEKLKADAEKAGKEAEFAKLLSDGKAVPAQKEAFIAGDMAKFAELASPVKIKTSENGTSEDGDPEAADGDMTPEEARVKLNDLTEKALSEAKFDSEAARSAAFYPTYKDVREKNPKLAALASQR